QAVAAAEKTYVIRKNDLLDVRVYTNKGEMLVDPNRELAKYSGPGSGVSQTERPTFMVDQDGRVNLPMVGYVAVENLSLLQADSLLQKAYNTFYEDSYVITRILNKRVIVLGAVGPINAVTNRIIPLTTSNMSLIEVLALAGGVHATGGSQNIVSGDVTKIRLIRGDLRNPTVTVIDLSTIAGLTQHDLTMQPNDIIYVEPTRRAFSEALRDIAPSVSIISSLLTLYFLISRTN
ncbi:MAG: polysaccharide export protein EpsE, partial [Sphingobacteriales bacterium]